MASNTATGALSRTRGSPGGAWCNGTCCTSARSTTRRNWRGGGRSRYWRMAPRNPARCRCFRRTAVKVKPAFGYVDPVGHWRRRLADGLAHNLSLVIAKAVHGPLGAGQEPSGVIRQAALFGTRNRDGWDTGLTILTALGQLLPFLSEEETHLALFHGVRRVAAGCDGATPRRGREPPASRPHLTTLKGWLRRWVAVRHPDAAGRTVLAAIARG